MKTNAILFTSILAAVSVGSAQGKYSILVLQSWVVGGGTCVPIAEQIAAHTAEQIGQGIRVSPRLLSLAFDAHLCGKVSMLV